MCVGDVSGRYGFQSVEALDVVISGDGTVFVAFLEITAGVRIHYSAGHQFKFQRVIFEAASEVARKNVRLIQRYSISVDPEGDRFVIHHSGLVVYSEREKIEKRENDEYF